MPQINVMTDLPHLGLLRIAGEGAKKFLQGQITCDLEEISPTQSRLGAHCNPQGRIISLFRLCLFREDYFLQMPRNLLPIAMAALKKYAVFFKVNLSDATDDFAQMGYAGSQLPHLNLPENIDDTISINDVLIIKVPGAERYELIGDIQKIAELKNQLASSDVKILPLNEWQQWVIRAGVPAIYPETTEKFLPHELNLPQLNGVSFKKGCYTGQEIIARMQYRGKLKKHLYQAQVTTQTTPLRGNDIYREKDSCGNIVDYCQVSYNEYELLVIAPESDVGIQPLSLDIEQTALLKFQR